MKNIILVGAPRAGKTTLTRMIKDKYQIISGDAIRVAYHKVILNDVEMSSGDVGRTKEFKTFLLEVFKKYLMFNSDLNFVLDTVDFDLDNYSILEKYDITIIVLGYTLLSPEEVVSIQKLNDIENKDWSFKLTDDIRLEKAKIWIEKSFELKQQCEKLGFKFVDTSYNRIDTLTELSNWINEN